MEGSVCSDIQPECTTRDPGADSLKGPCEAWQATLPPAGLLGTHGRCKCLGQPWVYIQDLVNSRCPVLPKVPSFQHRSLGGCPEGRTGVMWGEGSTGSRASSLSNVGSVTDSALGTWRNDLRSSVKVGRKETTFQTRCSQIKSSFINPQSSPVHSVTFQKREVACGKSTEQHTTRLPFFPCFPRAVWASGRAAMCEGRVFQMPPESCCAQPLKRRTRGVTSRNMILGGRHGRAGVWPGAPQSYPQHHEARLSACPSHN